MTLFDRFKHAAEQVVDSASRQGQVLQLQSKLGHVQEDIERQYAEAGKRVREMHRARQVADSQLLVIMERVDELEKEMEGLRQQVQDVQQGKPVETAAPAPESAATVTPPQVVTASPSQAPAPEGAPPTTPTAIPVHQPPVAAPPAEPEKVLCPECGAQVAAKARFCPECGEKLAES
ncbi:zinc-ribbon domain-containing protein [bacterium]|nr:zinc-ribbon domain-containing protein [bacterium]